MTIKSFRLKYLVVLSLGLQAAAQELHVDKLVFDGTFGNGLEFDVDAVPFIHQVANDIDANASVYRVAIIGAGAAGASAALSLVRTHANLSGSDAQPPSPLLVSVFEASDRIGGRAKTAVLPPPSPDCQLPSIQLSESCRENSVTVELGASMFVTINKHLMDAVARYNLTLTSKDKTPSAIRDEPSLPKYPDLGIYDGTSVFFAADTEDTWRFVWQAAWRWGILGPWRARSLSLAAADKFGKSYTLEQDSALGFRNIKDFLVRGLGLDSKVLTQTAREYFLENGVAEGFLDEFVEAATRVNYGQNLDCNAIAALICLVAAFVPGDSVVGGNHLIYEHMLAESGASLFLKSRVAEIAKQSDKKYKLTSSDGKDLGTFDDVILAVPGNSAAKDIKFIDIAHEPKILDFVHLHVTFVTGTLSHTFFNVQSAELLPSAILTTRAAGPTFNSIGVRHRFINDAHNTTITKIFSSEKLDEVVIANMYSRIVRVDRFEWDAYPVLNAWSEDQDYLVVLDENVDANGGVYHVNGFEAGFSTMESETVASANVVQLVVNSWRH
ncbi:hypothetical protein HK100_009821 [Physocladia obscura]|uniref:Prenylcysteine lyase domain-containing protein n=1 Tax=Physocladia obscura TaxID=109957 RepID=A0AAD5T5P9_9FUNG|nr:hypothetical protein HK100_009821 [Physocladia obscura]